MQETNLENQEEQYSPEEIKKMRQNMMSYYKDQIALLKLQSQYEVLLADIEEARAKKLAMQIRQAQMMAGPPEEEFTEEEQEEMQRIMQQEMQKSSEEPKVKRKLKIE